MLDKKIPLLKSEFRIMELTEWGRETLNLTTPDPLEEFQQWAGIAWPRSRRKTRLLYAKAALRVLQPEWRRDEARARYILKSLRCDD